MVKLGIELEFETNEMFTISDTCRYCENYSDYGCEVRCRGAFYNGLHSELRDKVLNDNFLVKSDGSLSMNRGVEINSPILRDFRELNRVMNKSRDTFREYCRDKDLEMVTPSPCAIHCHISHIKEPLGYLLLLNVFYPIFDLIISNNNSDIHFDEGDYHNINPSTLLDYKNIRDYNSKMQYIINQYYFSRERGGVTRIAYKSDYTIEFRTMVNRLHPKYYDIYTKIIQNAIRVTNNLSIEDIIELCKEINQLDTPQQMREFKNLFKLTFKEIDILNNKQNSTSKERFNDLIKQYPPNNKNNHIDLLMELFNY